MKPSDANAPWVDSAEGKVLSLTSSYGVDFIPQISYDQSTDRIVLHRGWITWDDRLISGYRRGEVLAEQSYDATVLDKGNSGENIFSMNGFTWGNATKSCILHRQGDEIDLMFSATIGSSTAVTSIETGGWSDPFGMDYFSDNPLALGFGINPQSLGYGYFFDSSAALTYPLWPMWGEMVAWSAAAAAAGTGIEVNFSGTPNLPSIGTGDVLVLAYRGPIYRPQVLA